jgi:pimeloyl-ACP methyl ester carboxylesterase
MPLMHYIRNGVRIAYDIRGEGDPVVLVCGGAQEASSWDLSGLPATLQERGYSVITFDHRGTPPSDAPDGPYAMRDMIEDSIGLLDHIDVGPARLMGYSFGGWVTCETARLRPDLVRCGCAIAGVGPSSAWEKASIAALKRMVEAGESVPPDHDAVVSMLSMLAPSTIQNEAVFPMFHALFASGVGGQATYGQICAWSEWASDDDKHLGDITRPMQVIAYEFDVQCNPQLARTSAEQIPDCEFVLIEDAGHFGVIEKNAETMDAMLDYFARH